jgi:hypothetical protein
MASATPSLLLLLLLLVVVGAALLPLPPPTLLLGPLLVLLLAASPPSSAAPVVAQVACGEAERSQPASSSSSRAATRATRTHMLKAMVSSVWAHACMDRVWLPRQDAPTKPNAHKTALLRQHTGPAVRAHGCSVRVQETQLAAKPPDTRSLMGSGSECHPRVQADAPACAAQQGGGVLRERMHVHVHVSAALAGMHASAKHEQQVGFALGGRTHASERRGHMHMHGACLGQP